MVEIAAHCDGQIEEKQMDPEFPVKIFGSSEKYGEYLLVHLERERAKLQKKEDMEREIPAGMPVKVIDRAGALWYIHDNLDGRIYSNMQHLIHDLDVQKKLEIPA